METAVLDTQMRLDNPLTESDVVIVDITQQDFDTIFQGRTSPLDQVGLRKVIEAVQAAEPCVVGVDIDTSFEQFKDFALDREYSNILWARLSTNPRDPTEKPVALNVLGGRDAELTERSGIPIFEDDEKVVTRFYSRIIETEQGPRPSFAWTVFNKAKELKCPGIKFPDLKASSESLIIAYSRGSGGAGRTRIPAANILKLAENNWPSKSLIKGKIVLIGGSYLQQDKHDTPIGQMNGVDVTANVVESEIRGGGTREPGSLTIIVLQLFDGVLLMSLFHLFPWRKAVLLSLPLILMIGLVCSFLTYYSFAHWAFFVPIMIGVLATELFDKIKDHFKKRYKKEIAQTYEELSGEKTTDPGDTVER